MKTLLLIILTFTSNAHASYNEATQENIEAEISTYLRSITHDNREYRSVDESLGDTVLEGDACERLYRGRLTKRCKAEIKAQVEIERQIYTSRK